MPRKKKSEIETTIDKPAEEPKEIQIPETLPVVTLRDVIIFPNMIFPLLAGRSATQRAVEEAILTDRLVLLLAQKNPGEENPKPKDMYKVGVVGRVLQVLRLPTGLVKILIEGVVRARARNVVYKEDIFRAKVGPVIELEEDEAKIRAALRRAAKLFKELTILSRNMPDELMLTLDNLTDAHRVADFIAAHLPLNLEKRQAILQTGDIFERLVKIAQTISDELEILKIEQSIDTQVKDKITRSQKNFYLQEQLRIIKKELGDEGEDDYSDIRDYQKKIRKSKMPKEVQEKAFEELDKLKQMPMLSPEASVIRGYLDWLVEIPWYKQTQDNLDVEAASRILEEDHFGLKKPKERILEYLAVMKLSNKIKGQIICFTGPPGVGKTSLGKSIARSLGRNFVRMSLGGIKDEAEIRGHRRTYVGSLPGRIIQQMKRAGAINPVFLLDEVDKLASDYRGDPASALLEVLDPEQNKAFNDHFLEVDYDLSKVLFITTANLPDLIPPPLLDRMEVIELHGYLRYEKFMIAQKFLIPKNLREHGLEEKNLEITEKALYKIIDEYTREAGVRELERKIAQICRKTARKIAIEPDKKIVVKISNLENYLGIPRHLDIEAGIGPRVGVVNGLAWTPFGGDIIRIEVALMKGKGNLIVTGQIGDVMKESAKASLSYIRSVEDRFKLDENDFLRREIHIHVPEGAVPKDGPSAGIAMTLAMLSALTGKEIPSNCGFTGEITLRGDVLPIGGLPEKLMAANRLGLKTVFIPRRNEKDLKEIAKAVTEPLDIKMVEKFEEVIEYFYR